LYDTTSAKKPGVPDGQITAPDVSAAASRFGTKGTAIPKALLLNDTGWINISDKAGQYITVTHNLNSSDIIVDITGKTTLDGGVHQKYYGLTGYLPGWSKAYGGDSYDAAWSVVQTSDQGYAIAGETWSFGSGCDFYLVKTDADGNMQWGKNYGGVGIDVAHCVVQTDDLGYAILGETRSFGVNGKDFYLVKTDADGNMQWDRTYGGANDDVGWSLVQTSDKGYALAGLTESFGALQADLWLIKTDGSGNVQWSMYVGGTGWDEGRCVMQTRDGGYAVAGFTNSVTSSNDFFLVKFDGSGNVPWTNTYGGAGTDDAMSLVQTSDNGYALYGWTTSFGAGGKDAWLVKTDVSGTMQWNKTYGGRSDDYGTSLIQTSDGGYALTGYTDSFGVGSNDFFLIKTDSAGDAMWLKTYGGPGSEEGRCVVETADWRYVIAGLTNSYGTAGSFWLVKTGGESESGLAWVDSTPDSITLYRGADDRYWNFVRIQIWKILS
jgi:hypothetical protein